MGYIRKTPPIVNYCPLREFFIDYRSPLFMFHSFLEKHNTPNDSIRKISFKLSLPLIIDKPRRLIIITCKNHTPVSIISFIKWSCNTFRILYIKTHLKNNNIFNLCTINASSAVFYVRFSH